MAEDLCAIDTRVRRRHTRSMRLSTKLSLAVALTSVVVLGAYGFYQVRQERGDLDAHVEREVRLLGSAIKVAIQNALRDHQIDDVRETLEAMEKVELSLDVYVIDSANHLIAASGDDRNASVVREFAAKAANSTVPPFRIEGTNVLSRAIFAFRLQADDGQALGTVVVIKGLAEEQSDMVRTRMSIALSLLGLIAALWAVASALGYVQIRRPLAAMTAKMRTLRAGELAIEPLEPARDEVGMAMSEFNALVGDLRQARARLETELEARRELEQGLLHVNKLVTVGQLAAGLAHEIGSPLQILSGRAHALLESPNDPAEVCRQAQILVEQSERVARIVEQLVGFSRRVPPKLAEQDLRPIVRSVVELIEYQARRKGVEVALRSVGSVPEIFGDRDRIQQVVLNLLNNALRATPRGGHIRVSIEAMAAKHEDHGVGGVRIVVEDDGRGMDEQTRTRAFEPFFTTEPELGGTGLGLATARMIVIEHGGHITCQSEPGKGSRFTIELPGHGDGRPALEASA